MRKTLPLIVLLSLICFTTNVFGQKPAPKPEPKPEPACPQLYLSSPDVTTAGAALTITVSVTGGDPAVTPTYKWSVSDGEIKSGQGESTITVDTAEVASGLITATVEVGGYNRECPATSSSTTSIEAKAEDEEPAEDEKPPR